MVSVSKRKETDSTITSSSSPPDDNEHPAAPSQSTVESSGLKGSAPTSPSSDRQNIKCVGRPPGMTGPVPSPIGKVGPGHSKNTSATSPLLTLTPNSSVDGNSDWHSLGTRHSSPFQVVDAPALPFLQSEHRRGGAMEETASFGSLDLADGDNDGLLGLEALRDRARSSPSPVQFMSSPSPPPAFVAKGHFHAHGHDAHPERMQRRDRPPLSQSYQDGFSNYPSERGMGYPMGLHARSGSDANSSVDSSDLRGLGAIARPDLRQQVNEYDMNRRRASSTENFHNPYQNGFADPALTAKFGTLPTLGSHIQLHRGPESYADLQKPRHVRSISQPMPANGSSQQQAAGMDARFFPSAAHHEGHSHSTESQFKSRSGFSHPAMAQAYDGGQGNQKRVSLPNLGGVPIYSQPAFGPMQRQSNDLDFQLSSQSLSGAEDIRSYGTSSMISPGTSPMQIHYGSHSRQPSDAGSALLSSSPMSLGGGIPRAHSHSHGMMHHRQLSAGAADDDLTHPLVGEHIDVPDHEDVGSARFLSQSLPQLIPRHAHSVSLDQIPPHYIEASHHLPTAGATLPMPKIVYSVKFKRTQRNFALGPRIVRDLKIGTYVKVEADRGEDLGIVVGKVPAEKYSFSGRSSFNGGLGVSPGVPTGAADLKRIIRLATHDEVSLLGMKREEEEELLKICRSKVRQRGLPMNVVDAEYQFDRHKLTFFFEAEGRVDFRELVRDLFSMYKTRIWMQQLDKSTSTSSPAILAPHPSSLQMDYGTPIIAPVSEFADSIVLGGMSAGDARSH